jgi:uncharacterized protein YjiK
MQWNRGRSVLGVGLGLAFVLGYVVAAALTRQPRLLLRGSWLWPRDTLKDPGYVLVGAAKQLRGVNQNISGLTYSTATNTLFAVINQPERVVELDQCGRVLRILPAAFGDDIEAISHVAGDLFVIASEKGNEVWGARIAADTKRVVPVSSRTLSASFNGNANQGLEGLSWDHRGQRLFLANEKNPLQIVEVRGSDQLLLGQPTSLSFTVWNPQYALGQLAGDVSSISFNERWNAMTVLSHESRRVFRFDGQGEPSLILRLERGHHGLREDVSQPEGLAFGPEDDLYIVAEPTQFYRFVPRSVSGQRGSGVGQAGRC